MEELGLNAVTLAEKAQINPTTVRRLLRGETTASAATRARIADALDWPVGHGMRLARQLAALEDIPTDQLIAELGRRLNGR